MNEDEEDHYDNEAAGLQKVVPQDDHDWVHVLKKKKKTVRREQKNTRNRWMRSQEMNINGLAMQEVFAVKDTGGQSLNHS